MYIPHGNGGNVRHPSPLIAAQINFNGSLVSDKSGAVLEPQMACVRSLMKPDGWVLGSSLVGRSRWSVLRRAANFSLSWVILLTFGRQKGYHTITTGRLQISTRARHERGASSQTFCVAGVFPLWHLVRPSQDGERGERLTNTLFGAKDGGRHRQERALVLTSLRRTMRRRALATLSYDNMGPGPKARFQRLVNGLVTG